MEGTEKLEKILNASGKENVIFCVKMVIIMFTIGLELGRIVLKIYMQETSICVI